MFDSQQCLNCSFIKSHPCPSQHSFKTSLEDLGAATCKLVNFVDYKVQSPLEVLWKSFGSPLEVLQKSSAVVASVTDRQTHGLTFGLLGPKISTIKRDDMMNDFLAFSFITLIASHSSEQLLHCLKCVNDRDLYT